MPDPATDTWLLCSACRTGIPFRAVHWVCSVSTCNRARTRLVFCSVACWDSHLSTLRHREAWAVEARAPSREEQARDEARDEVRDEVRDEGNEAQHAEQAHQAHELRAAAPPPPQPPRALQQQTAAPRPVSVTAHAGGPALSNQFEHDDVLIVVSKMKKYIRDRSGMSTSDAVTQVLGDHVRSICDEAIRAAERDGRKTVLDRDVPRPRR